MANWKANQLNGEPPTQTVGSRNSTYWERVAETRWGRYVTGVETQALKVACLAAGKPGTALEVGCEGGRWSEQISDWGWTPICLDIDPQALAACQARVPQAQCFLTAPSAEQLPCDDASMRLILCIETFPVMQSDWFPAECRRVLEAGGVLMGIALNRSSLRSFLSRMAGRDKLSDPPYYTRSYSWARQSFRDQGFSFLWERGLCWAPFMRKSNSPLVPLCTTAERVFALQRLVRWSPWVAFVARRN
jgi:2-polyprenyl-3-methyl-5-hydroxy-6-metoxy-1,4-benzoquinol methylase